ncbi:LysR family transcriptional regulator [Streptomyces mobaraensis]|uniref:LysR family transcriptional regulator n=1 Tax=Streptomyces sp. TYQ1024 TaxID=2762559 RepID=UPI00163C3983|nr:MULTISPECIES: LysR family transcriptional regulator [Streptomyces]MBC2877878.1 LysR family transcriptional regulator [Streptomyces sp. TYQ1024]UBI38014.1 LysR family transcriptional regulator [Streptomyces mobaraensis]UKW30601.1 LysR family transcriptional regulator [Streptomyces sp. TYQ1024]
MVDIEVRELRYFRAVVQELNFSRAARRLGMSQPPLSRAIAQLERRLGVRLFERGNRRMELTPAGIALAEEAVRALDAVEAAARRTRRAGAAVPSLVLTAKAGVATHLLRRVVTAYRALPGAPDVRVTLSGYGEQAAMVRDGRADVALLGTPFDRHGIEYEPLFSEPRVAVLPAGHPLAARAALSCADLEDLPMPNCPGLSGAERAYWSEPGVPGPVVRDSSQLMEAVALGQAVALIPESLAELHPRGDVVHRPVPDAKPYETAVAWREGIREGWVGRLVRTVAELAEREVRRAA